MAFILEETAISRVRKPSPNEITANVPADMPIYYLRRILERALEDAFLFSEDTMDAKLATERWHSMGNEGSMSWEDVKKELDL